MTIQCLLSQFFAGKVNWPLKVAPACSSITSPQRALAKAAFTSPPALTLIIDPGAGVSDIPLETVTLGSSAGPSKLPACARGTHSATTNANTRMRIKTPKRGANTGENLPCYCFRHCFLEVKKMGVPQLRVSLGDAGWVPKGH